MKNKFERQENKYLINTTQFNLIKEELIKYMIPDQYHESRIKNIYYDTPSFLLIRKSIEKPIYKEKLRIRSYGIKNMDDIVFLELKKKYKGVVYKRRVELSYKDALTLLSYKDIDKDSQIIKEIKYLLKFYKDIMPRMFLSYDRLSFVSTDKNIRITFDSNITYRDYDLDLIKPVYGDKIIKDDEFVMEIKTSLSYPKWLVDVLNKCKVYKQSFSKYGNAYKNLISKKSEEIVC